MISFALVVAALTLGTGIVAVAALRRLPSLRLQLFALALLAVLLPLGAVVASGVVMFHSEHDLTVLAVAAASSAVALVAALAMAHSIRSAVDRVRDAARRLAAGDLSARARDERPREIAELAASFNAMAEDVERLFDARTQLVAWASHDLRTPLSSIQAMLEALEDGLASPDEYLPRLRDQVRALGLLIDDLFELARIDSGALTLELRDAELDPLVQRCLEGIEAEAQARRIHLRAELEAGVRARCAPEKVERVLYNLLANALRHTPSDGSVAVCADSAPGEVRVSVEDTGEGLRQETVRRMFDRFWREDRARSSGGSGLGLAIARGLVEAQGGRIWAENGADGGARVSFTLPAP